MLPCAACLIDENGDILFANRRTVSLSGFTQEELTGSNIAKYGLTLQDIHALLENKAEDYVMKEMVTKDMEAVPMSVGAARLSDAPYVLLSFNAAPQYVQAVKEKSFFKSVVDSYPFAVTVQDRRGVCLVWNEKAEKMFGKTASAAVGHKINSLLPSELEGALNILDKEVREKKQNRAGSQMSFKNNRGREIILSVTKVPTFDAAGELQTVLTVSPRAAPRKKICCKRAICCRAFWTMCPWAFIRAP